MILKTAGAADPFTSSPKNLATVLRRLAPTEPSLESEAPEEVEVPAAARGGLTGVTQGNNATAVLSSHLQEITHILLDCIKQWRE